MGTSMGRPFLSSHPAIAAKPGWLVMMMAPRRWAVLSWVMRAVLSPATSLPAARVTSLVRPVRKGRSRAFLVLMYLGSNQSTTT